MAFYADVYGYIAVRKGQVVTPEAFQVNKGEPAFFSLDFSHKTSGNKLDLISFACNVKLNEDEDALWLAPFENILRSMEFASAVVNFMHEESNHIMMYSYVKDGRITRFTSKQTEEFIDEVILQN